MLTTLNLQYSVRFIGAGIMNFSKLLGPLDRSHTRPVITAALDTTRWFRRGVVFSASAMVGLVSMEECHVLVFVVIANWDWNRLELRFCYDWNCLAGLDNIVGDQALGTNIAQIGDNCKIVPKQGIEAMPMQVTSNKQVPIQSIAKQPSFVDIVNGDKPLKFEDLRLKLQSIWKLDNWHLVSLGRGCFQLGVLAFSNTHGPRKRHCVVHSVAKCKSVIGKTPLKVGSHGKEKENKAPGLTQVHKLKQAPPLHVESTTLFVPTTNTFEVLNTDVPPTLIEEIDHHQAIFNMANTHTEIGIGVRSTSSDLGAAPNRTDFNTDVGKSVYTILRFHARSHHGQTLLTIQMM
ncbi:hypothetical protein FNV43_RR05812 [Rhamnella rubrinervis]|uniref:Uncharacterized protein n=1 Tax=Rhamnella rubrinervis TaxID=2594499 RepID=A0A8K0MQS6_9ROSA|nr:hypothetical protein FNV43_RR05812 [Rhamnella rubrinervis]